MEEAWNMNISDAFNRSRINVLEEIMMEWFKKYDPVFMCVCHKHHPFGNKRSNICCGLTSILWISQIVESKYLPQNNFKRNILI